MGGDGRRRNHDPHSRSPDIAEVREAPQRRHARGKFAPIVVVAEGAIPAPGTLDVPEPQ